MKKQQQQHSLPIKDFQQLVDELEKGPLGILSKETLYSLKQMIRRAMEVGYWHGVAASDARVKIQKKMEARLKK
jgi:hypothetical protein